jgi:hypothetical protein
MIRKKLKNFLSNKRGTAEIEILTTVVIAAIALMILPIIPEMVSEIASLVAVASAEATARDLGGLITISGAAIEDVTMTYMGADAQIVYDVTIENGIITVKALDADKLEPLSFAPAMLYGYSKIPFDVSANIRATNIFTIDKSLYEAGQDYKIYVE